MQIDIKEDERGYLIPFYLKEMEGIKRFFIIKNKNFETTRGYHAHRKDFQKLILLNGEAEVEFENYEQKSTTKLKFGVPYLSKPYEWLVIKILKEDTIILVLCSEEYDESEYIRDYEEFQKIKGSKNGK